MRAAARSPAVRIGPSGEQRTHRITHLTWTCRACHTVHRRDGVTRHYSLYYIRLATFGIRDSGTHIYSFIFVCALIGRAAIYRYSKPPLRGHSSHNIDSSYVIRLRGSYWLGGVPESRAKRDYRSLTPTHTPVQFQECSAGCTGRARLIALDQTGTLCHGPKRSGDRKPAVHPRKNDNDWTQTRCAGNHFSRSGGGTPATCAQLRHHPWQARSNSRSSGP